MARSEPDRSGGSASNPSNPHGDDALLPRLRAGDEEAFTELVTTHHTRLLRLARVYVRTDAVAEEVVQEAWVGVLEGLHRFEGRSSLKTWLYRIVVHRALTRAKQEARTVPFSALGEDPVDPGEEPAVDPSRFTKVGHWGPGGPGRWEADTPDAILERREVVERLRRAVDELPPAQRAVVFLRDLEGLSSKEVCSILELRETNQRVLLHRGRSKLRAILESMLDPGAGSR